jgi:hypothetical protein
VGRPHSLRVLSSEALSNPLPANTELLPHSNELQRGAGACINISGLERVVLRAIMDGRAHLLGVSCEPVFWVSGPVGDVVRTTPTVPAKPQAWRNPSGWRPPTMLAIVEKSAQMFWDFQALKPKK